MTIEEAVAAERKRLIDIAIVISLEYADNFNRACKLRLATAEAWASRALAAEEIVRALQGNPDK